MPAIRPSMRTRSPTFREQYNPSGNNTEQPDRICLDILYVPGPPPSDIARWIKKKQWIGDMQGCFQNNPVCPRSP